ncbi:type II secretion system protein [Planctomycetota bacterium]
MKARKGFTLVEILIVVVILGILAAIVIPQFTDASTEAKEASMRSDLQMLRSQIELYKIQHNDEFPGSGTGSTDFETDMTTYTEVDGTPATSQAPGQDGVYGPYMQSVPTNPFNDDNTVASGATDSGIAGDTGWFFNTTTGAIRPDDTLSSPDGTAHIDL